MHADTKDARRTTCTLVNRDDAVAIEVKAELRCGSEVAKFIDILRALTEAAWDETITFGEPE